MSQNKEFENGLKAISVAAFSPLLPDLDSNQDKQNQNLFLLYVGFITT